MQDVPLSQRFLAAAMGKEIAQSRPPGAQNWLAFAAPQVSAAKYRILKIWV
jgi:hypothetical protein